ncbi:hypothetical protein HK405_009908 [Cladochytrium tenue]|nr:hypothetical protein HK405_009908 [Cladochytrium tenue]
MRGTLFRYHTLDKNLTAFETGPADSDACVVFLAGMTEGFLAVDYLDELGSMLSLGGLPEDNAPALRFPPACLVQPLLSSSYTAYGVHDLASDVQDLDHLLAHLLDEPLSTAGSSPAEPGPTSPGVADPPQSRQRRNRRHRRLVLMGHSTGAQIAVAYARSGRLRHRLDAIVLQAPVSDREYFQHVRPPGDAAAWIRAAEELVRAGRPDELLPREADDVPMSARRFLSLYTRL